MDVHLTSEWPRERVERYGREITAAIRKLVERFPNELTVQGVAEDIFSGRAQLWLVLDGEKFVAMVMTEIKNNEVTGRKTVIVTEMAGGGGTETVPLIAKIEAWARSIGAHSITPMGRLGWRRALEKQGYKADVCLYRKELA